MKFIYKARDSRGKVESGTIEANSKDAAIVLLQKYNVFVTSIQEDKAGKSLLRDIKITSKVSRKEVTIFFRQLAVMLDSRVPVVQSLASLAGQTKNAAFRDKIMEISNLVQEGVPLSGAFAAYPKIFDAFYVNLVKSGEASGNIAGALNYVAEHLEREGDIRNQLRQALIYPIFVVCVLLVVMSIVIVEVMPRVVDLIKETNAKPPFFTVLMINFYQFLEGSWWIILLTFILLAGSAVFYLSTRSGRDNFNRVALKTPFFGSFLKKVFLTRFCGNISTLITAGISINKALKITEDTVNNVVYKDIIGQIGKDVASGEKMSAAMLRHQTYFPSFVIQMIKVGEETGKLDKTLGDIVNFYQKEIQRSIDLFSSLLEPVMIIFLGIVVAMLAISVLSPLYGALGTI